MAYCKTLAKVNAVAPHCLAANAGLMEDDLIEQFLVPFQYPRIVMINNDADTTFAQAMSLVPVVSVWSIALVKTMSNDDNDNDD